VANFTFVARDLTTNKAAHINPLAPETDEEKALFAEGEARDAARKRERQQRGVGKNEALSKEYRDRLEAFLAAGRTMLELPALADRNRWAECENTQNVVNHVFLFFCLLFRSRDSLWLRDCAILRLMLKLSTVLKLTIRSCSRLQTVSITPADRPDRLGISYKVQILMQPLVNKLGDIT
jgi:hypothetical protein